MQIRDIPPDERTESVLETHAELSRAGTHEEIFRRFMQRARRMLGFDYFVDVAVADLPGGSYRVMDRGPVLPEVYEHAVPPRNLWDRYPDVPVASGGFVAEIARGERPRIAEGLALAADPVLGEDLAGYGSCLAVPVFDLGRVAQWILLFRRDPVAGQVDAALAVQACNLVSQAIIQRKLVEQVEALNAELSRKVDEALRVQRSMLPPVPPLVPGLRFATLYQPCDAAGGDYYDFRLFENGHVGIVVADVAGHGPAASVVMAMMRTVMGAYRAFGRPPNTVVGDVNDVLIESLRDGMFVTAFFARIDPTTGSVYYANCGHQPPRVRRADGNVEVIPVEGSPPLGILPDLEQAGGEFRLAPGELLLLHTDGIVEAFDSSGAMLGEKRLDATLAEAGSEPERAVAALAAALERHTDGRAPSDDRCAVAVRFDGR